jgi:hypothetical protein
MITLKQLTEEVTPESALKKLDELYSIIKKTIKEATSEEGLINSMLIIKKQIDKFCVELPYSLNYGIAHLFRSNKKLSNTEKQIFYSLGLSPKQLLFVIQTYYATEFRVRYMFLTKLRSFIGSRQQTNELYWIKTTVHNPQLENKTLYIYVEHQSADYMVFSSSCDSFIFYVVKL